MKTTTSTMKTLFAILLICCALSFSQLNAQTYVHHGATGANDGSSWTDAYTSLKMAIDNAAYQEEIWVAAGTYLPDTTTSKDAHFLMSKSVILYGGFEGTETAFSERDPESNFTILSGDISGDDITQANGNLLNRSDNLYHILIATSGVDSTGLVDGFSFEGGYADGATNDDKNGGAIRASGPLRIRNCTFYGNYAKAWGGAVYTSIRGAIHVANCTFEKNKADDRAGGLCFSGVRGGLVDSCVFIDNEAERSGGGLAATNSSAVVSNSEFTKNECLWGGGAVNLINSINNHKVILKQNTFSQNKSSAGGALVIAVYGMSNTTEVLDCEFTNNQSISFLPPDLRTGGAIGIVNYDRPVNTLNHILIENCLIEDNEGANLGGGIGIFNEGGVDNSLIVRNCQLINNMAANGGGGMALVSPHRDYGVEIERTHFSANESQEGAGMLISRKNGSPYSTDLDVKLISCLFSEHAQSHAALMSYFMKTTLYNCTFGGNTCVSLGIKTKAAYFLQNNIIHAPGYKELEGFSIVKPADMEVSTGGGNVVGDTTLDDWMGADDITNEDPLLREDLYSVHCGSPAYDFGKFYPGFMPSDLDLAGNSRWDSTKIDAGAYENEYPCVGTSLDLIDQHTHLKFYPVPVITQASLELDNAWRGQLTLKIYNSLGQEVYEDRRTKYQDFVSWQIDLQHLTPGTYRLLLTDGKEASLKSFIKN